MYESIFKIVRVLVCLLAHLLTSCSGETGSPNQSRPIDDKYKVSLPNRDLKVIIAGQSNASLCDWSAIYELGHSIRMIAVGGQSIQNLIDYPLWTGSENDVIFWIHGEEDAYLSTMPAVYTSKMIEYFDLIYNQNGGVEIPVLISLVGYDQNQPKDSFDDIRKAVKDIAIQKDTLIIAFEDAYTFADRNMLRDHIHFDEKACAEMVDAFITQIQIMQAISEED